MIEASGPEGGERKEIYLPDNLALTVFYSRHLNRSDLGDFNEFQNLLRSSDIYIPESLGWSEKDVSFYRQISQGNRAVLNESNDLLERKAHQNRGFLRAINEALFNSHVRVVFADIPYGTPEHQRQLDVLTIFPDDLFAGTFDEGLNFLAGHYRDITETERIRDGYIINRLGPALRSEIQANQKLRKKGQINALMTIGSDHLRVASELSHEADEKRIKTGKDLPMVMTRESEVTDDFLTTIILNGGESDEKVRELLARRFFQLFGLRHILQVNPEIDYEKLIEGINSLSVGEIEVVFKFLQAIHFNDEQYARRLYYEFSTLIQRVATG
jgi:hypothetical protein